MGKERIDSDKGGDDEGRNLFESLSEDKSERGEDLLTGVELLFSSSPRNRLIMQRINYVQILKCNKK